MPRLRADGFRGWLWEIPEADEHAPIPETPYPDFVTKLLRRRGIANAQTAAEYLFDRELPDTDPMTIPGAAAAINRIEQAIRAGERIAVYGDFDVDGITATAILTEAIRAAGGTASPYIPDRFREGYGINRAALERLRREQEVTLVVTADCGITARAEIAAAGAIGQDVIIVDHHSMPPLLPDCAAIVNPKFDPASPFTDHSSGGVAYRIGPRLLERFGRTAPPGQWLDLATLSTIADVVPLRAINRRLVRDGLLAIRSTTRPGMRALLEVSGLWDTELDSDSVGYALAPRINAAGRLAHADLALSLLLTTDPAEAHDLALELDQLNLRRRQLTTEAMTRAAAQLQDEDAELPITFIGNSAISSGIVGLVAGRLAEERHRPAVVYEEGAEESRASCRSIPGFDMAAALRACDDLLLRHGGHAMAAGFTARTDQLPAVKARLADRAAEALAQERLQARIVIDAQTPLDRVGAAQVTWLQRMAPFGEGNPAPTFLSTGVTVSDARPVGADATHLRLTLRAGEATWQGIGFGLGAAPVAAGDAVDVVWTLKRNGRYGTIELEVKDLAPATA